MAYQELHWVALSTSRINDWGKVPAEVMALIQPAISVEDRLQGTAKVIYPGIEEIILNNTTHRVSVHGFYRSSRINARFCLTKIEWQDAEGGEYTWFQAANRIEKKPIPVVLD